MKTYSLISGLIFFAFMGLFSCSKDIEENPGNTDKPIFMAIKDGEVSELHADIALGGYYEVHLVGQKSNANLRQIKFLEEGYLMSADRITINDVNISANPLVLDGRQVHSFELMIKIKSHDEDGLTKKYFIILEDNDGNTSKIVIYLKTRMILPEMTISANEGNEIIFPPGGLVSVRVAAKQGSFRLKSLSVLLKNDFKCHTVSPVLINPYDIYFGYSMIPADSNPYILDRQDSFGFDKNVYIRVPAEPGLYAYCIMLVDNNKNTVDDWFKVKVMNFEESSFITLSEIK